MAEMRHVVSDEYRGVGIAIAWVSADELRGQTPASPQSACVFETLILVNLIDPVSDDDMHGALGTSIPGARLIRVAVDRVDAAKSAHLTLGAMLGYVVSHEIGHLLMPGQCHAIDGLMRETLYAKAALQSRLAFLASEATRMRTAVAQRMNACAR